jgi:hypothetical protein
MRRVPSIVKEPIIVGDQDPVITFRMGEDGLVGMSVQTRFDYGRHVPSKVPQHWCQGGVDIFVEQETSLLGESPNEDRLFIFRHDDGIPGHDPLLSAERPG